MNKRMMTIWALAGLLMLPLAVRAENAAGKKVFVDSKCNKCHAGPGVEKLKQESSGEEAEEEGPKVEPHDLSKGLSDAAKKLGDEKLAQFLKKEIAAPLGDKGAEIKHKKKFEGSDADLKAVLGFVKGQ